MIASRFAIVLIHSPQTIGVPRKERERTVASIWIESARDNSGAKFPYRALKNDHRVRIRGMDILRAKMLAVALMQNSDH